jgi:hypothetical protein
MNSETYNGWTNYETWVVKLWMDNDHGSSEYWKEQAEQAANDTCECDPIDERKSEAEASLAEALDMWHDEQAPDTHGVFADLIGRALGRVNWREIAESLLEEVEFPVTEAVED